MSVLMRANDRHIFYILNACTVHVVFVSLGVNPSTLSCMSCKPGFKPDRVLFGNTVCAELCNSWIGATVRYIATKMRGSAMAMRCRISVLFEVVRKYEMMDSYK
jgi:hypothetical protein